MFLPFIDTVIFKVQSLHLLHENDNKKLYFSLGWQINIVINPFYVIP